GRGQRTLPTPVAALAAARGLPALKPRTLKDTEAVQALADLRPDVAVVVAYGLILPESVLALPPRGCVNVHPSLLPRYRGAAPIHAPILAGDTTTGVTIMYMDAGLDTGDIILQEEVAIAPDANAGDMHDLLAVRG